MRNGSRTVASVLLVLMGAGVAPVHARPAPAPAAHFVCPPCGLPCDSEVHDGPGTCPKCGMKLVEQDAASKASGGKRVGILIFTGVQIIDYTGPYEIFQAAGFDVYTVAESREPITTVAGMTVVPKYAFADAPQPDILVVPGGGVAGALGSAATLKWVRETSARTERTLSVCNGAFILAKSGLLEGLTATTTHGNVGRLAAEFPGTKVVDDRRYVDNGKIITAGGLTAGIDGALHVVALTLGKGIAQKVALGEEYDWHPEGGFARGTLADTQFESWIDATADGTGHWELVSTEGGTDRWEVVARGTSDLSSAELLERFGKVFITQGKWKSAESPPAGAAAGTGSRWRFIGRDGRPWTGTLTVTAASGDPGRYTIKLAIARAG